MTKITFDHLKKRKENATTSVSWSKIESFRNQGYKDGISKTGSFLKGERQEVMKIVKGLGRRKQKRNIMKRWNYILRLEKRRGKWKEKEENRGN